MFGFLLPAAVGGVGPRTAIACCPSMSSCDRRTRLPVPGTSRHPRGRTACGDPGICAAGGAPLAFRRSRGRPVAAVVGVGAAPSRPDCAGFLGDTSIAVCRWGEHRHPPCDPAAALALTIDAGCVGRAAAGFAPARAASALAAAAAAAAIVWSARLGGGDLEPRDCDRGRSKNFTALIPRARRADHRARDGTAGDRRFNRAAPDLRARAAIGARTYMSSTRTALHRGSTSPRRRPPPRRLQTVATLPRTGGRLEPLGSTTPSHLIAARTRGPEPETIDDAARMPGGRGLGYEFLTARGFPAFEGTGCSRRPRGDGLTLTSRALASGQVVCDATPRRIDPGARPLRSRTTAIFPPLRLGAGRGRRAVSVPLGAPRADALAARSARPNAAMNNAAVAGREDRRRCRRFLDGGGRSSYRIASTPGRTRLSAARGLGGGRLVRVLKRTPLARRLLSSSLPQR